MNTRLQRNITTEVTKLANEQGLTPSGLSKLADTNRAVLWQQMKGNVGVSLPVLERLCRALGVSVSSVVMKAEGMK